jgi:hypothetical protein
MDLVLDEGLLATLVQYHKVVGDKTRLKIIGLLSRKPHSVGELAEELELTAPTISHHLAKLREAGLLNLRAVGTSRIYKVNDEMLKQINHYALHPEEVYTQRVDKTAASAWIDTLAGFDEEARKVLKDYTFGERLRQIPAKEKKLVVVLRWLATKFEPGRRYTEAEVTEILSQYNEDYASLRRALVEFRFLAREDGGGLYWLAAEEQG